MKSSVMIKVSGSKILKLLRKCSECGGRSLGGCCPSSPWKTCQGCGIIYPKKAARCVRCRARRKAWDDKGYLNEEMLHGLIRKLINFNTTASSDDIVRIVQRQARPVVLDHYDIREAIMTVRGNGY